ncbi:MAG: energy-coupled thiamine transporter ThiT [Eubacteriales bacterium]|nr:energy-coupled thiamine transporter ThiT [Eubacteriales bacterium]
MSQTNVFVTAEGGLTTAGYAVFIIAAVAALVIGAVLASRRQNRTKMTAKEISFCAAAIALAFVTSYIILIRMPFGGTVTLFSMLFIVLIGNWYGPAVGILVGLAYGILQFIQDPYFLSFLQVCCDYLFAFAALGVSGFFRNQKHGLLKGYIAAVLARGVFASLAGYLFWMSYMPENFPASLAAVYPIVYNYMYLLVEGVLTIILIQLPPVSRALNQIKKLAVEGKASA